MATKSLATRDTTPVILTTGLTPVSIAVTGGVPGAQAQFPNLGLTNTLRVPIEVREFIFTAGEPSNNVTPGLLRNSIEILLNAGRYQITQSFVPLIGLTVRRDSKFIEGAASPVVISNNQFATYRWTLPKPLVLAPNETINGAMRLSPAMAASGDFSRDGTVTLIMTARAHRLPEGAKVPSPRVVPFASGFMFTQNNVPAPDILFQNIFPTILHVTSINGAVAASIFGQPPNLLTANFPGGLANTVLRGLVTAARGAAIFAERTSLEEPFDLDPGEDLQFTLSNPGPGNGATAPPVSAIVMTGWREEA